METSKAKGRKRPVEPTLPFEAALEQLEEAVSKLEAGDLSLEASLQLFAQGMEMSSLCLTKLQEAEQQIDRIVQEQNGQQQQLPWKTREDDE